MFPVALDATAADWAEPLKSVKEQLRAVPRRGIGYGALRHLGDTAAAGPGGQLQLPGPVRLPDSDLFRTDGGLLGGDADPDAPRATCWTSWRSVERRRVWR